MILPFWSSVFWVITKGCFKKKSQSFRFTAAFASDILTNKKTNVRKNGAEHFRFARAKEEKLNHAETAIKIPRTA